MNCVVVTDIDLDLDCACLKTFLPPTTDMDDEWKHLAW